MPRYSLAPEISRILFVGFLLLLAVMESCEFESLKKKHSANGLRARYSYNSKMARIQQPAGRQWIPPSSTVKLRYSSLPTQFSVNVDT